MPHELQLRPYQQAAVEAVYHHLRTRDDNPCVVIPTGGGKTAVLAAICRDAVQRWNGRVVILAHVKELLEQAAEKLHLAAPDLPVGLYSASLKRRDLGYAITIASIQSIYQRAASVGAVDLVIVDECHLIPPDGEGMYRTFLEGLRAANPLVRIIGLTATPFRMKTGTICAPEHMLHHVCFEVGVRELIVQGYLCPLRSKAGSQRLDVEQLHVRGGEYVAGEVEQLMDDEHRVLGACCEIVAHTKDRRSVLIFAAGVAHGTHICRVLAERHGVECGFVSGETLPFQRDELIGRFRAGDLKYLCNVNVSAYCPQRRRPSGKPLSESTPPESRSGGVRLAMPALLRIPCRSSPFQTQPANKPAKTRCEMLYAVSLGQCPRAIADTSSLRADAPSVKRKVNRLRALQGVLR